MLVDTIYDAAFDGELFARLPDVLAAAVGARSGMIHWSDRAEQRTVSAMNAHFSADDMALYERDFAPFDLWTQAVEQVPNVNYAWVMTDLVPEAIYRDSVFFNEWNRRIGDDTFYALGGALRTPLGEGCIGLHRGEGAGDFDGGTKRLIEPLLRPLARVLSMRAAIEAERARADTFAQFFHLQADPAILIDGQSRVIEVNRSAEERAQAGNGPLRIADGLVQALLSRDAPLLAGALAMSSRAKEPEGSSVGLVDAQGGQWVADFVPVHRIEGISGRAKVLVTMRPIQSTMRANPAVEVLRTFYGLTAAEAQVAIAVARGDSPAAIAQARGTSRETVRSQIKQVMGKLGTHRQSGIAALVAALT